MTSWINSSTLRLADRIIDRAIPPYFFAFISAQVEPPGSSYTITRFHRLKTTMLSAYFRAGVVKATRSRSLSLIVALCRVGMDNPSSERA